MKPCLRLVVLSVILCSRDCRQSAVCDHRLTGVMEYAAFSGLHKSDGSPALYNRLTAASVPK